MPLKQIISLVIMSLSVTCYAQFRSSSDVYCYEYVKTDNDGIVSKSGTKDYYFVNFQNDMMGYYQVTSAKTISQNLLENENYYADRAINALASSYDKWISSPWGMPTMGPLQATATILTYCDDLSTYSKYTYRTKTKLACNTGNVMDPYGTTNYWSKPKWGSSCYSFSTDMSEMIIWSTSNPSKKKYYKLIDVDDLKPNTDFLYE